ncbi:hypothetical protein VTN00DRAFT_4047 [Thermoascus crustaceus]|uniref:uncharacterized protein n=1 Tax=Thermoascus crustaceus TaxID=5088 RepID=UPI0037430988
MAPRRGGGSSGSGSSYYNDDSPWNEEVPLGVYGARARMLMITALVFEIITLVACLVFLLASFFIKRSKGDPTANRVPSRSLIYSILSNIIRQILAIVLLFFYVLEVTVKQSYVVLLMFWTIFELLALVLIFYVFYRILHNYLDRLYRGSKSYLPFTYLHWAILGVISVLSLVEAVLNIVTLVQDVNRTYGSLPLILSLAKLSSARKIISWLASLEIILCSVFVVIKSGALKVNSLLGSIFLGIGNFFFFFLCFSNAIIAMRYYLGRNSPPDYLSTATSVIWTIGIVGLYTGIVGYCMLWRKTNAQYHVPPEQQQQQYAAQQPVQYHQQPVGQFQAYQPPMGQFQQQQPGMYQVSQPGFAPQPTQWQQQQQSQYGQVSPTSPYQETREMGSGPANQVPQGQTSRSPGHTQ